MTKENLSLGEAAVRYLSSLPPQEREASQQEVYRFVRWYGWERPISALTPPEVGNYAERLADQAVDMKKLEPVRSFLTFARKDRLTPINLSVHLRAKKAPARVSQAGEAPQLSLLTEEGRQQLKRELETLQGERLRLVEEVKRAREDKDFRENAPLDAAREQMAKVSARIMELEGVLARATAKREEGRGVAPGHRVTLLELASGASISYVLVDPREADLERGKLSVASPIGRGVLGKHEGEVVEVSTPAGLRRYRIEKVEA
jgi:transcription elongation factor GreA